MGFGRKFPSDGLGVPCTQNQGYPHEWQPKIIWPQGWQCLLGWVRLLLEGMAWTNSSSSVPICLLKDGCWCSGDLPSWAAVQKRRKMQGHHCPDKEGRGKWWWTTGVDGSDSSKDEDDYIFQRRVVGEEVVAATTQLSTPDRCQIYTELAVS